MQSPTYGINLGNYYTDSGGRDSASRTLAARLQFHVCTSLAPRPWFGNETTCTTLENGVLRNGQELGRAVDSLIDQVEFVAMKMLSGYKAPRCDKHQFCDKMTVST